SVAGEKGARYPRAHGAGPRDLEDRARGRVGHEQISGRVEDEPVGEDHLRVPGEERRISPSCADAVDPGLDGGVERYEGRVEQPVRPEREAGHEALVRYRLRALREV